MQEVLKLAVIPEELYTEIEKLANNCPINCIGISKNIRKMKEQLESEKPDIIIAEEGIAEQVSNFLPKENRPTFFLLLNDNLNRDNLPLLLNEGIVDDIITSPFRRLELLNCIRWHYNFKLLHQIGGENITEVIQKMEEDILFAQKIQRHFIKNTFPPINGLSVSGKYWSGLRSGGDYFDVFEFKGKNNVGILLVDFSSYRLSSAFLYSMMTLPANLKNGEFSDPRATVSYLHQSIQDSMKENDGFSIFYGVIDKRTYNMEYVVRGNIFLEHQDENGDRQYFHQGENNLFRKVNEVQLNSNTLCLNPADRLIIRSDGFDEGIGQQFSDFFKTIQIQDPETIISELNFALKQAHSRLPQDCSILLIDVEKNVIRLAQ